MTRELTVVTPENTSITFELAGIGSRAIAYLMDVLILTIATVIISVIFRLYTGGLIIPHTLDTLFDWMLALYMIATFLLWTGYFVYFESVRNGQTPGKKYLGLRVIMDEGAPVDISSAIIRNIVRIAEMILFSYIISIISMFFSPGYKRIGDYAAGTIVVREASRNIQVPVVKPYEPLDRKHAKMSSLVMDVSVLTREQISVIRKFSERRMQLDKHAQEHLATTIAAPIVQQLEIVLPTTDFSYADFLDEVYNRVAEEFSAL